MKMRNAELHLKDWSYSYLRLSPACSKITRTSVKVGKARLLYLFNSEYRNKLSTDYSSSERYEIVEASFAELTGDRYLQRASVASLHVSVV